MARASTPGKLIAIAGKASAGKTTLAEELRMEHGYRICSFAGTLKATLFMFLNEAGCHHRDIERYAYEEKDEVIPEVGFSWRQGCQRLGTEWGRALNPNLWVNLWKERVTHYLFAGDDVVADDMRFPNEVDAALELGGVLVWVERKDAPVSPHGDHESEQLQPGECFEELIGYLLRDTPRLARKLDLLAERKRHKAVS